MIVISGKGAIASPSDGTAESILVLADESLLPRVATLRDALPPGRAITWITGQSITSIALDDDGGAADDAGLPFHPGRIPVPRGTPLHLATDGPDAGSISFGTGLDAWIRYFYPGPAGIEAFRFEIFSGASTTTVVSVTLDPSRPADASRNFAKLPSPAPLATNFCTAAGVPLTLATTPTSGFAFAWDPAFGEGYQVLGGAWVFRPATGPTGPMAILLGQSGSEYASLPPNWVVQFVPGGPAYAPGATAGTFPLTTGPTSVDQPVTTSWIYFTPATGPATTAGYFSQPQQGPLFTPGASGDGFLEPLPLLTAGFPSGATGVFGAPAPAFPMAPYAGITIPPGATAAWAASVQRFEAAVLNPARTQALYQINELVPGPIGFARGGSLLASQLGPTAPSGPTAAIHAVTPQGLLSQFSADGTEWLSLTLATAAGQVLQLTDIDGVLREALLSNQLFLVISDPLLLQKYCSTPYAVTDQVLRAAEEQGVPHDALAAAATLTAVYPSRASFAAAITAALGPGLAEYVQTFVALAPLAQLSISGWTFQFAPQQWIPDAGGATLSQTVLIMNFCDQPLQTLIGDLSRWTLGSAFNDDPAAIQAKLQNFIGAALSDVATDSDLQYFVSTVLGGGGPDAAVWNGILYLNAPVPPTAFPPQLAGLAAGIPSGTTLTAHHFGVNLAPFAVAGNTITVQDSSLFALILYDDPTYLVYQNEPYAFQVNSLHVLFINSAIAAFSSQVELLVAQLFGEPSMLQDSLQGDNILFTGVWQHQGGQDAYSFSFNGINNFAMTSQVLAAVIITSAQFVTLAPGSARFLLAGVMQFQAVPGFDIFSFGPSSPGASSAGLPFSNLYVTMTFDPEDASSSTTFTFVAAQMQFGTGASARAGSLYAQFPLNATAMLQSGFTTSGEVTNSVPPDALGFMDVDIPIAQPGLGSLWFGLQMDLSLGTAGALAPTLPFTASFLAAWSPDADAPNVAVGLRLPGFNGLDDVLPIEGPLTLSVGGMGLTFNAAQSAYLMTFENIALKFLSLTFPPATVNAMLFGNPDPTSTTRALGWYAAYTAEGDEEQPA